MSLIVAVVAVVLLACVVWADICNERTYQQRMKIHAWVFSDAPEYESRLVQMQAVTYAEHCTALIFFRKPRYSEAAEMARNAP